MDTKTGTYTEYGQSTTTTAAQYKGTFAAAYNCVTVTAIEVINERGVDVKVDLQALRKKWRHANKYDRMAARRGLHKYKAWHYEDISA